MTWLLLTAGQGPDECQRFVHFLVKEIHDEASGCGLACDLLEANPGTSKQTLLSALLTVEGPNLKPFIEAWTGTHRWICPSPFRPHHGRKNWFAGIKSFSEPRRVDFCDGDIRVDTFRSSGPGGQHATKTSSAVRMPHLPSGIVVIAQEERSQRRNRALASARLHDALNAEQSNLQRAAEAEQWMQHISLERGNEIHVYVGEKMKRRK